MRSTSTCMDPSGEVHLKVHVEVRNISAKVGSKSAMDQHLMFQKLPGSNLMTCVSARKFKPLASLQFAMQTTQSTCTFAEVASF